MPCAGLCLLRSLILAYAYTRTTQRVQRERMAEPQQAGTGTSCLWHRRQSLRARVCLLATPCVAIYYMYACPYRHVLLAGLLIQAGGSADVGGCEKGDMLCVCAVTCVCVCCHMCTVCTTQRILLLRCYTRFENPMCAARRVLFDAHKGEVCVCVCVRESVRSRGTNSFAHVFARCHQLTSLTN